jgi:hypothetical protein
LVTIFSCKSQFVVNEILVLGKEISLFKKEPNTH